MSNAAIYVYGIPGIDKPEAQKTVIYNKEIELINHLKKLQAGYLVDEIPKDKVRVNKVIHPKTGKTITECYSNSDYKYVVFIGWTLKPEANKPVEHI